jgi:hemerythrin-like metal-binding protein
MLKLGYQDIEKHKLLHKKFVQEVESYVSSCSFGDIPYAEMLDFLVKWLTGHIMVEDRKYATAGLSV